MTSSTSARSTLRPILDEFVGGLESRTPRGGSPEDSGGPFLADKFGVVAFGQRFEDERDHPARRQARRVTAQGTGIDLIEIDACRARSRAAPTLAERIFTRRELELLRPRARPARHLAARFAAKEAALKALGLGGLRLHEVEVEGGRRRGARRSVRAARRNALLRSAALTSRSR